MPQLNKGGKFVFGISRIHQSGAVCFPEQTISEYKILADGCVIIFTGSKTTGGFCVTSKSLLMNSKLHHILAECPQIITHEIPKGEFIAYKGRSYAWLPISQSGNIILTSYTLKYLNLSIGDLLMCIRSSDIAFTMGAHGPLMEKVKKYQGDIKLF